jgi:hypothetical protein
VGPFCLWQAYKGMETSPVSICETIWACETIRGLDSGPGQNDGKLVIPIVGNPEYLSSWPQQRVQTTEYLQTNTP